METSLDASGPALLRIVGKLRQISFLFEFALADLEVDLDVILVVSTAESCADTRCVEFLPNPGGEVIYDALFELLADDILQILSELFAQPVSIFARYGDAFHG